MYKDGLANDNEPKDSKGCWPVVTESISTLALPTDSQLFQLP